MPHYRRRRVTPPLVAHSFATHPRGATERGLMPAASVDPSVPATTVPVGSLDALDGVDVFELGTEHEQVVFCNDAATGPQGDRRDPLDGSRPRPRRHALLPLRVDRGRDPRRPQPLARDVLQERAGRARPRRRQGRDHRRPDDGQDRGAAAGLRPVRAVAERSLHHRLRRRARTARTWTSIARECDFVTGRTVAHGGAGDSSVLTAYGVFQGMRASAEAVWGAPTLSGRTVGVAGVGKVGHHLVKHLVDDGARVVVTDVNPRGGRGDGHRVRRDRGRRQPTRWCGPRSTSTRRARWVGR